MWSRRAWVLLLLISPAAADSFVLPDELDVTQTPFFEGEISWTLNPLDPVVAGMTGLAGEGTWTSCPVDSNEGLIDLLVTLNADCPDGQTFEDPEIRLHNPLDAQLAGRYGTPSGFAGRMATAADRSMLWQWEGPSQWTQQDLRMAPTNTESAIELIVDETSNWFNGTSWLFLFEASQITWSSGTAGCSGCGATTWTLSPADARISVDVFTMLRAQELALGEDAKQNRSALASALRGFGSLPHVVDGSVRGNLDGTAAGWQLNGDATLVRYDQADFRRLDGTAATTAPASIILGDQGVGDADRTAKGSGLLSMLLWIVAGLVLVVRRHSPPRAAWQGAIQAAGLAVVALVLDAIALARLDSALLFGNRPDDLHEWVVSSVALGALVAAATLLYVLPLRAMARRILHPETRFTWIADTAAWLVVALGAWIWPLHFLAWASRLVRF
ncbi:MAG: hypothetical protein ACPHID_07680 [Thermoplasmatota archaeon]